MSPETNEWPFKEKVIDYQEAISRIRENRGKGLRVVLASGVFDLVHIGHIDYLTQAKSAGNLLFVGVERDEYARLNKGKNRPLNSLEIRLAFLSALQPVDFAFGYNDTPVCGEDPEIYIKRYRELNPNLLAVTSWNPLLNQKRDLTNRAGVELLVIDKSKRNSTTNLLKMIGYE